MLSAKYLVVGAGFYGAVMAERIAEELGEHVIIIDKRNHIGGNSYSSFDKETGIECHTYGSHIFHTKSKNVWEYISRFTLFNSYRHKVLTTYKKNVYHIPINLLTINTFFKKCMKPNEARDFIMNLICKNRYENPKNFEEKAISLMGIHLYEAFIKGYTIKQWQTDPRQLPASIINRIPVNFNYDLGYFSDPWQGIPLDGYTAVFNRLLNHSRIEVKLGIDFFDIKNELSSDCYVIYSGPIDRYFDYRHGRLAYRSLRFENNVVKNGDFQGTAVMNYADVKVPYTRIHEFRHYHPERTNYPKDKTCITYEYSIASDVNNEPYYPVNTSDDQIILAKYVAESALCPNLLCGGRLGSYQYLDMDDAIKSALDDFSFRVKLRNAAAKSEA